MPFYLELGDSLKGVDLSKPIQLSTLNMDMFFYTNHVSKKKISLE